MKKKSILITGGSGLLGSALLKLLNDEQYNIICTCRKKPQIKAKRIKFITCDLSKNIKIKNFPKRINTIVHLAQYCQLSKKISPKKIFQINAKSTRQLLNYGYRSGAEHFIYASTGGIYSKKESWSNESEIINQRKKNSLYLESKFCGEKIVDTYKKYIKCLILRPFFIYGHAQNRERLIPKLVSKISKREPINLSTQNGILLNPIHVEDAAKAISVAIKKKFTGIVNLSGNESVSLKTLSNLIGKKINQKPTFKKKPAKRFNLLGCNKKMRLFLHNPTKSIYTDLVI